MYLLQHPTKMNAQAFFIFPVPLMVYILVLQVFGDCMRANKALDESADFPRKSQYSGSKVDSLINGTLGDCILLDLEYRNPAIHIHNVIWKKGKALIGMMINGQNEGNCTIHSKRCFIYNNGTLSLCPTQLDDIGHYTVTAYTEDGRIQYSNGKELLLTQSKLQLSLTKGTLGDCMLLEMKITKQAIHLHDVIWKKGNITIGKVDGQNITTCIDDSKRCLILNNGSLSLCPTHVQDIGQYTAEVFTKDGVYQYSHTIQLELTQGALVAAFLVILGSCIYHFGKWKRKPVLWKTRRQRRASWRKNVADYAVVYRRKQDQSTASPELQKPQAIETTVEGQGFSIGNEKETATAAAPNTENPMLLNISTFQEKENALPPALCMNVRSCSASLLRSDSSVCWDGGCVLPDLVDCVL
ncbi:uncharacterized protein LOC128412891 isoform X2 [Podarcis raffonei]|uniref:uncharacterized protein LOC128412891 isoform X2 n=1 Tax=Podarcis raffonei TaxID=65483 RepID=UPI0023297378|nr:uncharacterized protein LOC128412891 isoform X2 [Podarcis raffonei]